MMTPMLSNPPRATNMTSGGLLVFVSVWSTRTCHMRLSAVVRRTNSGHSDRGRGAELVLPRSITCAAHARHSSAVPARLVRSTSPWTESEQLAQARARTTTRRDNRNFIARPISPNDQDHRPRATGVQHGTRVLSRGSVHPLVRL